MSLYSATIGESRISFKFEGYEDETITLTPTPSEFRFLEYPHRGIVPIHLLRDWASRVGMEMKSVRIEGDKVTVYGIGTPGDSPETARVREDIEEMQFLHSMRKN